MMVALCARATLGQGSSLDSMASPAPHGPFGHCLVTPPDICSISLVQMPVKVIIFKIMLSIWSHEHACRIFFLDTLFSGRTSELYPVNFHGGAPHKDNLE